MSEASTVNAVLRQEEQVAEHLGNYVMFLGSRAQRKFTGIREILFLLRMNKLLSKREAKVYFSNLNALFDHLADKIK